MTSPEERLLEFRKKNTSKIIDEDAKLLLFGRWLSMNYTTDELNGSNGEWWLETLQDFKETVLPNFKENKSYESHVEFLKEKSYAESRKKQN